LSDCAFRNSIFRDSIQDDAMTPTLPYLKETASQTAGPYVHIGLIPHQAGSTSSRRTSPTSS
jgi:protocatechuate 3,4-dioxygenase beta subunit